MAKNTFKVTNKSRKIAAVIYSDLHLEDWKKFNEHDRRINNGLKVMKHMKLLAKRHRCPILFAGDILHREKSISNYLLARILPPLSKLWGSDKTMTYGITGNHSQSSHNLTGKPSPSYLKTFADTFPGLECLDFASKEFDTWVVHGVPYLTHDIGLIESINKIKLSKKKVNILMLHTTLPEARDTDGRIIDHHLPVNELEKALGAFDLVFVGHIHKPEQRDIGKTVVVQVGAPQQQRLTDKNCAMGYWVMFENFDVEFVELKGYPKFIELEPNEERPDNKDFYVTKKVKRKKKESTVDAKKFGKKLSNTALAKNYCKEKKITDKKKKRALIKSLKQ